MYFHFQRSMGSRPGSYLLKTQEQYNLDPITTVQAPLDLMCLVSGIWIEP